MPRKLPWVADPTTKNTNKRSPAVPYSILRNKSKTKLLAGEQLDLVDSNLNSTVAGETYTRPRERQRLPRSPSTSPPPAPPDVEFMREGYDADDIYLMVEDEFLSTAKTFTQHIHHAEYVRLKKLARARGERTLETLDRGVDGITEESTGLKLKLEAAESARTRKDVLQAVYGSGEGSGSDYEDAYMLDPQLAGLMTKEKSQSHDLSGILQAKSQSRAAAGFSQSPSGVNRKRGTSSLGEIAQTVSTSSKARRLFEEEAYSEADEDLGQVSHRPVSRNKSRLLDVAAHGSPVGRSAQVGKSMHSNKDSSRIFKRFAEPERSDTSKNVRTKDSNNESKVMGARPHATLPSILSDESGRRETPVATPKKTLAERAASTTSKESEVVDEDWLSPRQRSTATSGFLAKRRSERDKKRVREEKASQIDDIPTFIF